MAYGATGDSGDLNTLYNPFDDSGFTQGKNGVYRDAQGNAFTVDPTTGQKSYLESYATAGDAHNESGFFSSMEWNPETGKLEPKVNWGNIIGLAAGAEPLIAGSVALAPGAGIGAGSDALTYGPTLEQLGMTPEEIGLATSGVGGIQSVGDLASLTDASGAGATDAATTAPIAANTSVDVAGVPGEITGLTTPGVGTIATSPGAGLDFVGPTVEQAGLTPVTDAAGNLVGATQGSNSILDSIGKYANALRAGGSAISSATNQAAQNRIAQNDPYVSRAKLEDDERIQALKDVYAADRAMHPSNSPFDPNPVKPASGQLASTLASVSGQDASRLAKPAQYTANTLPSLAPSTLEQVGNWLGPITSTLGAIAPFLSFL